MRLSQEFIQMLYRVPVLLLSLTTHELSHAFVAWRCGDTTAKDAGRITLNPIKHLDPIGALLLIVARFGWAKPVPINPLNFRNRRAGIILTSIAGPLSNLALAFLFAFGYILLYLHLATSASAASAAAAQVSTAGEIALKLFFEFVLVNISLAAFNVIPIPPLDGSKVLFPLLPERIYYNYILRYERYGMFLLMALSLSGLLGRVLNPIVEFLWTIIRNVVTPLALSLMAG